MMVGSNLNDVQLQQLVDRTIIQADKDYDGMISFQEFCDVTSHNKFSIQYLLDGERS
jgi:serine/threonine-protein phosphatase 2B regulatory subunit